MAGSEMWTVKGVSRKTREAVREAAAGQELTIGAWLDRVLWRAAQEALKPTPPPASRKEVERVVERLLDDRLAPLAEALERLERRLAGIEAAPSPPSPPAAVEVPPPEADGVSTVGVVLQRVRRRRLGA
jgi:hypothetical protein